MSFPWIAAFYLFHDVKIVNPVTVLYLSKMHLFLAFAVSSSNEILFFDTNRYKLVV